MFIQLNYKTKHEQAMIGFLSSKSFSYKEVEGTLNRQLRPKREKKISTPPLI